VDAKRAFGQTAGSYYLCFYAYTSFSARVSVAEQALGIYFAANDNQIQTVYLQGGSYLSPGMPTLASTMAATSRYGLKDRAWQQVRHLLRSTMPSAVTQIQPSASSMTISWPEEACACSVIKKNRQSVQAAMAVSPAKRACLMMEELAQSLTLLLAAQTPITAST